jgi:hypothetical protein
LQAILYAWYEEIQQQALQSAVWAPPTGWSADETGRRVNGKTHWLWCFTTPNLTYYMIDRSRGSPALLKFFTAEFSGTLVSDFWGAYNAVACAQRQMCLVHLLRDLEHVDKYKRPGEHWPAFAKKLRRLVADAIRLWYRQEELTAEQYQSRRDRLHKRLALLIDTPWEDKQAKRLVKRLRRHCEDLFTFLDQPGVPFDNNHAERIIRPAAIIRKNSYGNRSQRGADCQAVLMSVFRTLKQRGHDPVTTIYMAIATYLKTGQLPPLPNINITSNGLNITIIHHLSKLGIDHNPLAARWQMESEFSIHRALIQSLGGFDSAQIPPPDRNRITAQLQTLYVNEPDPGIHGSASWTLRQWGMTLPELPVGEPIRPSGGAVLETERLRDQVCSSRPGLRTRGSWNGSSGILPLPISPKPDRRSVERVSIRFCSRNSSNAGQQAKRPFNRNSHGMGRAARISELSVPSDERFRKPVALPHESVTH